MSISIVCDYCGEPISGNVYATVKVTGDFRQADDSRPKGTRVRFCSWDRGHYHAGLPDSEEPDCYWRINDAIQLMQESGRSLEAIPTISNQRVAARRRKHTKGDG